MINLESVGECRVIIMIAYKLTFHSSNIHITDQHQLNTMHQQIKFVVNAILKVDELAEQL